MRWRPRRSARERFARYRRRSTTAATRTAAVAREAARRADLTLCTLEAPGAGVGAARRAGDGRRRESCSPAGGLIACTDADSRPAPDWLARQLEHIRAGARVIAGRIELDDVAGLPSAVLHRRTRDAAVRLERVLGTDRSADHHHFAGASLGITAATYRAVGGIEPLPALEDAAFAQRLHDHDVPVLRAADVRVFTSSRRHGRAPRGLAVDLAVSIWSEQRRYQAGEYRADQLLEVKAGTSVDVVIPTKECAETITGVLEHTVAPLKVAGLVDDVVVVDADSRDGTAAVAARAGVRVLQQDGLLPGFGLALGKGDAMWRALHATSGSLVCFLDGDTADPCSDHLLGLLGPLLGDPSLALVKGAFNRPLRSGGREFPDEGGRVTELMARPLLNLHEPLLAGFAQPLAGEFAARRDVLEAVAFPVGYGVEIAVLIDVLRAYGLDALAESHLGSRQNRHQPLRALGEMAYAVLAAVERRIGGDRSPMGGHYLRPWADGAVAHVPIEERPPVASLRAIRPAGAERPGLSAVG